MSATLEALTGGAPGDDAPLSPRDMIPRNTGQSIGDPRLQGGRQSKPLLNHDIVRRFARWMTMKNIASEIDDQTLEQLAAQCKREFDFDDNSRADWKTKYEGWMKFAMQVAEQKTYPWPGAANVIYPLITSAALQFNARAYPAIVMGRNVVKGTVVGDDRGVPLMQQAPTGMVPGPQAAAGLPPTAQGAQPPPQPPAPGGQQQGGQPQPGQAVGPDGKPLWIVPPGAKQAIADRIGRHMSWQLLSEMPEWEEQTDRLLIILAIVGCMFRKNWFDPATRRNMSKTVSALRIVVNYKSDSFYTAPRVSEEFDVYPWDIETNIRSGLWLDHGEGGYGQNQDGAGAEDEQRFVTFIEQHRRWDLDGDGYDEPLIVTFAKDSGKLARIVPGFDEESFEATDDGDVQSIRPVSYYTKYGFIPSPEDSPYDVGFGHLLMPLNGAVNTSINQMFDAGHLQIAGGGFIGAGASINAGSIRFMTGEYKVVNTPGRALRENLVPLDMPGPNAVLLQLLQFLIEAAKDVGSIKDILSGDIPGANVPGILGLAVIQQGLKVFNAIFKRVHRALRHDYELLFRLNRLHLPEDYSGYTIGSEYFDISQEDYALGGGVEPVSDPDMVTDTQQMAQANFLLQFVSDPFFDGREIRLRAMQAANVPQIDKLLAAQAPPNAEIATALANLELQKQAVDTQSKLVDLRAQELKIRAAHQEGELDIRRGKDKAQEIRDLSQAILNLANAVKADAAVDQTWYAHQLEALRHQIDLLNIAAESGPEDASPALVAGIPRAAPRLPAGLGQPGVPAMAPPPGNQTGADILRGLSG